MRMILNHFNAHISEKEFLSKVKMHSFGTFSTDLAIPLIKRGFKVKAYTFNLPMFAHLNLALGSLISLEYLQHGLQTASTKMIAESLAEYVSVGGEIFWQFPSTKNILETLTSGPVLVSVNTAALGQYSYHWNNGHYLVVSDYNDSKFLVDDPAYDLPEGRYSISDTHLIAAITANALHSTDFCMSVYS